MKRPLLTSFTLISISLLLDGCSMQSPAVNQSYEGAAIAGSLHGGQQPVTGARIYLLAASAAGYGNASTSLLTTGTGADSVGTYVTTDGGGGFTLGGRYSCTASTEVYALALGGSPGAGMPANSAIALMTALGKCPASGTFASTAPYIEINEVTTVAAAYALSGFLTAPASLSYSGTPLAFTGLDNAFATAASLANLASGSANSTVGTNGTAPMAKVNTLADIIASCVNSTGPTSTPCTTLFNASTGSTTPVETITALLNIAHAPGANTSSLYGVITPSSPFQPTLTTAPNDFALTIQYTSPQMSSPQNLRLDASGNVWFRNDAGTFVVEKLSPTGAVLSGAAGFNIGGQNSGDSVALDAAGDAFVGNKQSFNIYKLGSDGTMLSPASGYAGSCSDPNAKVYAVALDGSGNVWGSGVGGCALKLTNTGTVLSGGGGYPSTSDDSFSLALDGSNVAWIVGSYGNSVRRVSPAGAILGDYGSTVSGPAGVAIDSANSAWIANHYYDSVTHLLSNGSFSMITGGGLHAPFDVSIDGAGSIWLANNGSTISAFTNAGAAKSGSGGYAAATSGTVHSLGIDGSGNVWAAVNSPDLIVEFVGAATPAARPILPGQLGVRP